MVMTAAVKVHHITWSVLQLLLLSSSQQRKVAHRNVSEARDSCHDIGMATAVNQVIASFTQSANVGRWHFGVQSQYWEQ
jgi:hypothetical protein